MAKPKMKPLPLWLARLSVLVLFVPAMILAAIYRFAQEMAGIPKYIWWDWCEEADAMSLFWRTGHFREEDKW